MKLFNWIIANTILISTGSYGGDIPHSQNAISIEECIRLALLNSIYQIFLPFEQH